ncbi:MAG: phytanoyl-CoA dioxygenase family protein [Erythrobacter sp.]
MSNFAVSNDTPAFEVPAAFDHAGKLTADCVRHVIAMMDTHGLAVITNLLSEGEADQGLALIRQTIEDTDRSHSTFASETDNHYRRRDFCSLPVTPPVVSFAAMLCQRLNGVYTEYCGRSRSLLEVATFTSYRGSSHQYLHRDPIGIISLFAAVEDVSPEQGGTVFVPGTHKYPGAENHHGGAAYELMELFRARCNARIFLHNLRKLWRMRQDGDVPLAPGEFRDRVFSTKWDQHQPNLLRFVLGKNAQFSLRTIGPRTLWKLYRQRETLGRMFQPVQVAPRKGTVIMYRSDLIHGGPDNRASQPRRFFGMSIARDVIETKYWHDGYSPHPALTDNPMCLGDLLDSAPYVDQPERRRAAAAR